MAKRYFSARLWKLNHQEQQHEIVRRRPGCFWKRVKVEEGLTDEETEALVLADIKRLFIERRESLTKSPVDAISIKFVVDVVLAELPYRERTILKMRYGLGVKFRTLAKISKIFRFTVERIRQIEQHGLRMLQHPRLCKLAEEGWGMPEDETPPLPKKKVKSRPPGSAPALRTFSGDLFAGFIQPPEVMSLAEYERRKARREAERAFVEKGESPC